MILSGRIERGARLPSTRALSADLGISRATVVLTYDQLASEGYVEGQPGAGVFVPLELPEQSLQVAAPARTKALPRMSVAPKVEPPRPFQLGAVDSSLFGYSRWARLLYRIWRDPQPGLISGVDPFGWPGLRAAIARHLVEWRGIDCAPSRIVVTSGTADATEIVAACVFERGDTVCIEEPGYPTLRYALQRYGIQTAPVAVGDDGIETSRVVAMPHARGVIVTPSRQFPLGATLPLARRLELLEWARATGATIVEDDFDSEYRYQGSPLPALTSLDRASRTVYVGSFSKVLFPTLRLGFLVLPEPLVERVRSHIRRRGANAALIAQPVLQELIASGEYATHIRRTRRIFARRMAALVSEGQWLDGLLTLQPTSAGMHVVADLAPRLVRRMTDRDVARIAAEAGIVVSPLADHYAGPPHRRAVLLGFAGFDEETLRSAVRRLAAALAA